MSVVVRVLAWPLDRRLTWEREYGTVPRIGEVVEEPGGHRFTVMTVTHLPRILTKDYEPRIDAEIEVQAK